MAIKDASIQFHMPQEDRLRLASLPWHEPLEKWSEQGVSLLSVRRGESRHPVVFVECEGVRYAIKETTPRMAEREIRNLSEVVHRGVPALLPVGNVTVPRPAIVLDTPGPGGLPQYLSGDRGYTVTRLALRVIPHALLYRLSLTRHTKQRLLSAVAVLMIELHEHGIYWGDPSLANTLIRIDGKRILAIMADAETTELFPGAISDGLRESDLAAFGESLSWQAEDMRQARGLPEDYQPLDETDFRYFASRYRWLRREHAHLAEGSAHMSTLYQTQQFLERLNRWSLSLLSMSGQALREFTAIVPGWYQRRIHELLHITIPRVYARRFYNMILGHQAIMSEKLGREMPIEEAAHHWYSQYHLPALLLLRRVLTRNQNPMKAYFEVMLQKWKMSEKAGYEVPLEEAIVEWSMEKAETGKLGPVDPASLAQEEIDRLELTTEMLDPSMIESEILDPLLSTGEKPLVYLSQSELEARLPEIVEKAEPDE